MCDGYKMYLVMIFIVDSIFCTCYYDKSSLKYCHYLTFFFCSNNFGVRYNNFFKKLYTKNHKTINKIIEVYL